MFCICLACFWETFRCEFLRWSIGHSFFNFWCSRLLSELYHSLYILILSPNQRSQSFHLQKQLLISILQFISFFLLLNLNFQLLTLISIQFTVTIFYRFTNIRLLFEYLIDFGDIFLKLLIISDQDIHFRFDTGINKGGYLLMTGFMAYWVSLRMFVMVVKSLYYFSYLFWGYVIMLLDFLSIKLLGFLVINL